MHLFGAENSVAGVAKAGKNVGILVEFFVQRGDIELNLGMSFLECFNSFGG